MLQILISEGGFKGWIANCIGSLDLKWRWFFLDIHFYFPLLFFPMFYWRIWQIDGWDQIFFPSSQEIIPRFPDFLTFLDMFIIHFNFVIVYPSIYFYFFGGEQQLYLMLLPNYYWWLKLKTLSGFEGDFISVGYASLETWSFNFQG